MLERIRRFLVEPARRWFAIVGILCGVGISELEIHRVVKKHVEADRVSRYIHGVDSHHEALIVQVNGYAMAVVHSLGEELVASWRNEARNTIIRLSQTIGNWEGMANSKMQEAIGVYNQQLGEMQIEISKDHDNDTIEVVLKRLVGVIESRRALSTVVNQTYSDS